MTRVLLAAVLALQAGRLQPGTGIVTGSIKVAGGGAAPGVRVGAIAIDDPSGTNLLSIAETDSAGRFRLTNIPEGNYYIVAGRVTQWTYYPGGTDALKAKQVSVEAARTVSSVDFTVPADSRRPQQPAARPPSASVTEVGVYRQALAQSNVDLRIKALLSFEKTYPKSALMPEVYVALADIYNGKHDPARVAEYSQKALNLDSSNVSALIYMSREFATARGDMRIAIQYAEKAVASAARLRDQSPRHSYNTSEWRAWAQSMQSSANTNLQWIRQLSARQESILFDNIRRR